MITRSQKWKTTTTPLQSTNINFELHQREIAEAIKSLVTNLAGTKVLWSKTRKSAGCHDQPREGPPSNPEYYSVYSFRRMNQHVSEHRIQARTKKNQGKGPSRRYEERRQPKMPSFSSSTWSLPSPDCSTKTVYTLLTEHSYREPDQKTTIPPALPSFVESSSSFLPQTPTKDVIGERVARFLRLTYSVSAPVTSPLMNHDRLGVAGDNLRTVYLRRVNSRYSLGIKIDDYINSNGDEEQCDDDADEGGEYDDQHYDELISRNVKVKRDCLL